MADRPTGRWRRRAGSRPRVPNDPAARARAAAARAVEEHRRLKERAANVIADQKLAELTLRRVLQRYDDLADRMRHAVRAAEDAAAAGDAGAERQRAATEALAGELVGLEREIDRLDAQWGRATAAADEAKERVRAYTRHLHRVVAERDRTPGGSTAAPAPVAGPDSGPPPPPPRPSSPPGPAPDRYGVGGEIRRAELRALLGLPAPRRDGAGDHRAPPPATAGGNRGAVLPPAYPVGSQPPRPDGPRRRR